eukprot:10795834-Ditylum_brightwellii.AAC.1
MRAKKVHFHKGPYGGGMLSPPTLKATPNITICCHMQTPHKASPAMFSPPFLGDNSSSSASGGGSSRCNGSGWGSGSSSVEAAEAVQAVKAVQAAVEIATVVAGGLVLVGLVVIAAKIKVESLVEAAVAEMVAAVTVALASA